LLCYTGTGESQTERCDLTKMQGGALRRRRDVRRRRIRARLAELAPPSVRLAEQRTRKAMTRSNEIGGRSSATPNERPPVPHQSEARGARPCIGSPFRGPHRKRPAHFPSVTVGFRSIIIFLTVCTRHRKPLLANDETARLIVESWQTANFWRVGRYVIMPDHIHLFCAPNTFPPQPLKKWIEYWRNHVTQHGRILSRFRFGSASFGIGRYAGRNPMQRNGSTYRTTRFATVTFLVLRTGRIKANSMCWNGTTGEHVRGLAELAPSFVCGRTSKV
jgi:hypothetical protein